MHRLTRYITWELAKIFVGTLTGLTVLMLLVGVAQEARNEGLGFTTILRIVPYLLPNALRFAVPGTILFAACSVFGRMAASNEIVAIKSLGISPMAVILPALTLAFVTSFVSVWLNDVAVSWGRQGVRQVIIESAEDIIYGMLKSHRSYSANQFSIEVDHVEGHTLHDLLLIVDSNDGNPQTTVIAKTAELSSNPDSGEVTISLTDSTIEYGDDADIEHPGTIHHSIPLFDVSKEQLGSIKPSDCPLYELPREIDLEQKNIHHLRESYASNAAYQMLTGDLTGLTNSSWRDQNDLLHHHYNRLSRLRTEPYRRWANGFSCFCFVMAGTPLAILLCNSDLMTTFGVCFLPILFFYYPLLAFAVDMAKGGMLPPYAVWLGNIVLVGVGCFLLRRVMRY